MTLIIHYTTNIVLSMLNRHHLRIKTLQALYSFFSSGDFELTNSEKALFASIDKIYELYIRQLLFIVEIKIAAEKLILENKQKRLPGIEDLKPNEKFVSNKILASLSTNTKLKFEVGNRKISWESQGELIRKIFGDIRNSDEYQLYMANQTSTFKDDQDYIVDTFCNFIAENELLESVYDEISIDWIDDYFLVNSTVVKTLKSCKDNSVNDFQMANLWRDAEDDKKFVSELFRKTILNSKEYEDLIKIKAKNWESDRIAMMDMLIMKMAICELSTFPTIPVKVSLNEYIELAKEYSTDKSKVFVNGILDKLVPELKKTGKIAKSGRGLLE